MERAILIGLLLPPSKKIDLTSSLKELERLTETAGAKAVEIIIQKRSNVDPAYYIGSGKAKELKALAEDKNIQAIIFDDDLKPVQQKNLEELLNTKIIDRTRLILDIFAGRARSREGILQVERAQMAYYLPRLSKKGLWLDSQAGGIGTRRGPGEKKLELDQRRIRDNIAKLDRDIENIRRHRKTLSKKRTESGQPIISIVGYTNAGKSTLLNKMSRFGGIYADDKLFATLDPTTRQVRLPGGRNALFSDTVGFINKLPHTLIAAFRATLEEIKRSNCIIHLIDASHPDFERHISVVLNALKGLNAEDIPVISVYNKVDVLSPILKKRLKRKNFILVSAKSGEGIDEIMEVIEKIVVPRLFTHKILLPYSQNNFLSKIYRLAVIKKQDFTDSGIKLQIQSSKECWEKIQFILSEEGALSAPKAS